MSIVAIYDYFEQNRWLYDIFKSNVVAKPSTEATINIIQAM